MSYKVKLEIFEGPMDLLLHLIKTNEVDIYDIPIATITVQYMEYVEMMKTLNLEIAGEFLLMAATLIYIKSKMLLPFSEDEGSSEDEELGDPRQELVRRLLEYQRYKDAAAQLEQTRILQRDVFTKGQMPMDGLEEGGLVNLSLFDLMEALKEVLSKAPKDAGLDIAVEKVSITDKINFIIEVLGREKSATFFSLFPSDSTRTQIIVTFLAMLELAKMKMIKIYQSEQDGVVRLYMPEGGEEIRNGETGNEGSGDKKEMERLKDREEEKMNR